jgi:hypothetical protein
VPLATSDGMAHGPDPRTDRERLSRPLEACAHLERELLLTLLEISSVLAEVRDVRRQLLRVSVEARQWERSAPGRREHAS